MKEKKQGMKKKAWRKKKGKKNLDKNRVLV